MLWAIALAGVLAAAGAVALALTSDHAEEPVLHVALLEWATLPYILAGLIACGRSFANSRVTCVLTVASLRRRATERALRETLANVRTVLGAREARLACEVVAE